MTAGSHQDGTTHGRKRLLPFLGADPLSKIDEDRFRGWLEPMIELVEAAEVAARDACAAHYAALAKEVVGGRAPACQTRSKQRVRRHARESLGHAGLLAPSQPA
jgi:hypothetical protein